MELIIDNRESTKSYFEEKNYKWIRFENLDIGDYIFKYEEKIILVIERKSIQDLASSIKDGRYREQKSRLLNNYSKNNVLFLIEGDLMFDNKSINFNKVDKYTIYSTLINLYIRDNFNVFISYSSNHTIDFLENVANKIKKQGDKLLENPDINLKENYDSSLLNTIIPKKNKNISPDLVYKSQLCNIPNISSTFADVIIEKYPNMPTLIKELESLEYSEKISSIQNLSYIKNDKKRKIGNKVATNLINNIFF